MRKERLRQHHGVRLEKQYRRRVDRQSWKAQCSQYTGRCCNDDDDDDDIGVVDMSARLGRRVHKTGVDRCCYRRRSRGNTLECQTRAVSYARFDATRQRHGLVDSAMTPHASSRVATNSTRAAAAAAVTRIPSACDRCLELRCPPSMLSATVLFTAVSNEHVDCITTYVASAGADVDERLYDDERGHFGGFTALMYACWLENRRLDVVEALLDAGADPNASDAHGNTPLLHCTRRCSAKRHSPVLSRLVAAGANPRESSSALVDLVCKTVNGCRQCLCILADAGAALDVKYEDVSPIYSTCAYDRSDMTLALIDSGASLHNVWRGESLWEVLGLCHMPLSFAERAHRAYAAYALARVLVTGGRRAKERTTITCALSDYRHVTRLVALLLFDNRHDGQERYFSPTLTAFEMIVRLAITGPRFPRAWERARVPPFPRTYTHVRRAVMTLVNRVDTISPPTPIVCNIF